MRTFLHPAILVFAIWLLAFNSWADEAVVRVGIYDNKPLVAMGSSGPEGLFVDVLNKVASEQGWIIQYRYGTWDECYKALIAGELELLPVVAYNEDRAKLLQFSDNALIANWGEIYTNRSLSIESIDDLRNQRIAFLENDTHSQYFMKLLESLGIDHADIRVSSYADMLLALEEGRADAGVFNHIQARVTTEGRNIRVTPLVFNPIQIRYASPLGDPAGLLPELDAYIRLIRSGEETEYRRLINQWFGVDRQSALPSWVLAMAVAALAVILLFMSLNFWLRSMVNKKTRDLQTSNKALRDSETKLRLILSSSMDGYLLTDKAGMVLEGNDIYSAMSGYTMAELVGLPVTTLDVNDNKDATQSRMNRIREVGSERFESRHRRKDGSIYDVEISVHYRPDNNDQFVSFIRDISERKRYDSVRAFLARTSGGSRRANFFYELARYLGESLNLSYVYINTIESTEQYAHSLAVWHEGQFKENISYPLKDTPCGEAIAASICWYPTGVQTLFPNDLALRNIDAEGFMGISLNDHEGRPIGLIALISKKPLPDRGLLESTLSLAGIRAAAELERLQTDQALREQAEYQRAIFDYSPLPMFSMDIAGHVLFCNAAAEQTFGWTRGEITGLSLPIVPEGRRDEFQKLISLLLSGQTISGMELVRQKKNGELVDVSLWSAPIYSGNKELIGLVTFYEDIRKRKAIEEEMRRNLDEKQILLREIHHRVKNNLSVISSLLNLQSMTITSPEQALEAFRNSRDRIMAMALVHMELYESGDFSRIDMGTYLGNLTRQIALVNEDAGQVSLSSHVETLMLGLQVAVPCGLILNELITNAYKYAHRDGQQASIDIVMARGQDNLVSISIADNGPGLPVGYENSKSLGLTLVKLLVDQIDGTMLIESSEKGTNIRIEFPEPTLS